jgi:hypothetical protein
LFVQSDALATDAQGQLTLLGHALMRSTPLLTVWRDALNT